MVTLNYFVSLSCGIQKYIFDKRNNVKLLFYIINIYSIENLSTVKKYMKLTYSL